MRCPLPAVCLGSSGLKAPSGQVPGGTFGGSEGMVWLDLNMRRKKLGPEVAERAVLDARQSVFTCLMGTCFRKPLQVLLRG